MRVFLWYLLLALCYSINLQAQSYTADIQHISAEDGLSNRFVNTIIEGSNGFMWIGTDYGLNRYDGYEFKLYTAENSNLTSNIVRAIYEDKNQRLWLIHNHTYPEYLQNNIDILDLKTNQIHSFEDFFKNAPFRPENIHSLYSDVEKNIWICTKEGKIYSYQNNRFKFVFLLQEQVGSKFIQMNSQFLWMYSWEKGLLKINKQGKVIKTYPNDPLQGHRPERNKYLDTIAGKKAVEIQKFFHKDIYKNNLYLYIVNPTDSLMWYADFTGSFFVFRPQKGILVDLQKQLESSFTYKTPWIIDVYFDSKNKAWVATHDGVFIITLKKNKFKNLFPDSDKNHSTRDIIEDDYGAIYVNTHEEKIVINPNNKSIKKYKHTKNQWISITKGQLGNIWYGDHFSGIEKYDPFTKKSQSYLYPVDSLTKDYNLTQWGILCDYKGRIWIGSNQGLQYFDPKTAHYHKFERYNRFPQLRKSTIYHLREDSKGIWISASTGLYRLEFDKGITARYATDEKKPYRIPYDHLMHYFQDHESIYWLATNGGGLIRFDPKTGQSRQFTTADNLSSNIIYAVYEDDYGKLWLPGNYGLMQFDKKNYRVNTYLKSDGIAHNEFNTISHYQAADGKLYFGGLAGVTVFDPKDFRSKETIDIPLRITECKVLNKKTGILADKTSSVANTNQLVLTPSDKSFSVTFSLLNYEGIRQNSYAYKIEGFDTEWTSLKENTLRIAGLPYGSYTIHIKGQGAKGQWSRNQLAIAIDVNKPFYLKNWFILLVTLSLILIIYGVFYWRLQSHKQARIRLQTMVKERTKEIQQQKNKIEEDKNTIEQQATKLRELDKVKSRFFANISHELRTPLTLILGHIGILERENYGAITQKVASSLSVSKQNSQRLLKLVEEILDLSKLESGQLQLHEKTVAFYPIINRVYDMFRSYAAQKKLKLSLNYKLSKDVIIELDENKFEKVLTNLLSNAIKYTDSGSIQLEVDEIENPGKQLQLKIIDTGRGIHANDIPHIFERFYQSEQPNATTEGGAGIGLALAKELTELMGGTLSVQSQYGEGSTFCVTLPKKVYLQGPTTENHAKGKGTDTAIPVVQEKVHITETIPVEVPLSSEPGLDTKSTITQKEHTVLVVEDHDDMRRFIVSILEGYYHVHTAVDGIQALELLNKSKDLPDLILSDIMMPHMDGFALLEKIKSDPDRCNIPIVMLTARAAQEDRLQALTIGVDDYLTKPFDEKELLVRMRNLLVNYNERKKWQQAPQDPSAKVVPDITFEKQPESWKKEWLQQAEDIVKREITNYKYKVSDLAAEMLVSERQLRTKMKQVTGLSPNQFIREIKLQKARLLLENNNKSTIAEIAYAIGFDTPEYFSKVYENHFGKRPTTYFE